MMTTVVSTALQGRRWCISFVELAFDDLRWELPVDVRSEVSPSDMEFLMPILACGAPSNAAGGDERVTSHGRSTRSTPNCSAVEGLIAMVTPNVSAGEGFGDQGLARLSVPMPSTWKPGMSRATPDWKPRAGASVLAPTMPSSRGVGWPPPRGYIGLVSRSPPVAVLWPRWGIDRRVTHSENPGVHDDRQNRPHARVELRAHVGVLARGRPSGTAPFWPGFG